MKRILLTLLFMANGLGSPTLTATEPATAAKRQVLIEAVILEVALDGSGASPLGQLGIQLPGSESTDQSLLPTKTPLAGGKMSDDAARSGAAIGSYTARLGNSLEAMLATLSRDSRVRILQRPRIQTSDAVRASLFVGETRPCPALGAGTNIQQIPIGTTLDVTPTIEPGSLITMDLRLRLDRFEGNTLIQNVGEVPMTSSREAQTRLTARDHETVLLGGIIRENKKHARTYVPFPKEVPAPAILSTRASARFERTEVLVLIRPTLLSS